MNNNKPPQKSPPNWEKQAFLTLETMPDTPKTNLFNIKISKKPNPKDTICHVQKQPTIFHKFSGFFQHTVFVFEKLRFAENTIKIVFSGKHSFSKTQLVKPTFSPMSKNTFFQKKVSFLLLGNFRWNHYFYSFSWFTLLWAKKIFWPKQIVCTKMRVFFSLPDTNSVSHFLQKIHFFLIFHIFAWPP